VPDAVPRNERTEQIAPTGDGTTVRDGDLGEGDHLGDGASLTERIALRSRRRTGDDHRHTGRGGVDIKRFGCHALCPRL